MPYGTGSPELDAKVERCVNKLQGDYTKVQKIKICKASILARKKHKIKSKK